MKRPLTVVAIVYAVGLLAADLCQPPVTLLFAVVLGLVLLALCLARLRPWLILPLVFFTGWTNLAWRTTPSSPHDLRRLRLAPAELVTFRGTLTETPSPRIYVQDERESSRSLAIVELTHLCRHRLDWEPAFGTVLVLTPGWLPELYFAGQEVEVQGVLTPPPGPLAEGLFDYGAYLRRKLIFYQLKAAGTNDWRLLSAERARPLSDRFLAWAQATLARGLPGEDESLRLLWAMTLGWKTSLNNEVYEPFMQSGTMHIFAISGLHIALIAGIFVRLLRVLQLPRLWCGLVVVPLIWFYTGATGWQASAIRSTVMMTLIIGGWALSRPSDLLNSLAVAAFCILLWDPQQLFGASFQLSFFVVLSIALLVPPFETARDRWLKTDPLLPPELVPGWRRFLQKPLRWVTSSMAISLAAWIGSLPLTAYYFHLVSPVTLLANLVVVPLSSCALACNLGSLLCGSWLGWATELFNHSAWFWMEAMIRISHWSTRLPRAYGYIPAPRLSVIALYYALVVGFLTRWLLEPKRRPLVWAGAVALAATGLWHWQAGRTCPKVTVLPLHGGFGVFARHPQLGGDVLVDCGRSNAVQFVTKPFLHGQGVNRLPTLVLSHGDVRHVGGAEWLAAEFAVRQVCASSVRFRSPPYRRALRHFQDQSDLVQWVSRNDRIGPWTVLHPEADDRFSLADEGALVLQASFNGTRVLLLSDLGRSGQRALLERTPDLRADIVITGLPSASEPLSDAMVEALHPHLIIVADSDVPASERASARLKERLRATGVPVVYLEAVGAATLEFRARDWKLRTMNPTREESRSPLAASPNSGEPPGDSTDLEDE